MNPCDQMQPLPSAKLPTLRQEVRRELEASEGRPEGLLPVTPLARHLRHEERFNRPGVIGLAAWHLHALVGLRAADAASGAGVIVTKPFALPAPGGNGGLTVLLNLDTTLGSTADLPSGQLRAPPESWTSTASKWLHHFKS